MKSPFPGMDPFLEGYLWPDVHAGLAFVIKELLVPQIQPKYVARVETYTVQDTSAEEDMGIMYPDVDLLKVENVAKEPTVAYSGGSGFTPVDLSIPAIPPIPVKVPVTEIRDRHDNRLITAIEILSPVNKRNPGLLPYQKKRKKLYESGVHLLEIDLLRRGKRPFSHPNLPASHYLIGLTRAKSRKTDIWTVDLKDSLPILPVPLKKPDPDVKLELGKALNLLYERSLYNLSIDYTSKPPPPALTEEERNWVKGLL